jgi:hypothetical protein
MVSQEYADIERKMARWFAAYPSLGVAVVFSMPEDRKSMWAEKWYRSKEEGQPPIVFERIQFGPDDCKRQGQKILRLNLERIYGEGNVPAELEKYNNQLNIDLFDIQEAALKVEPAVMPLPPVVQVGLYTCTFMRRYEADQEPSIKTIFMGRQNWSGPRSS